MSTKVSWEGLLIAVQPRIRLGRSFDESYHTYLGYVLRLDGERDGVEREFCVAIGKAAQEKHHFQAGDVISGVSQPVADERTETAEFYKTSGLELIDRTQGSSSDPPPWLGVPPDLETYRKRGHRRLASRTYEARCGTCIWGCRMPVEIIVDHWNPHVKRYRFETFCYGPKSCGLYKAGPRRRVPGRKGMTYVEEDWVDENATSHRSDDE